MKKLIMLFLAAGLVIGLLIWNRVVPQALVTIVVISALISGVMGFDRLLDSSPKNDMVGLCLFSLGITITIISAIVIRRLFSPDSRLYRR